MQFDDPGFASLIDSILYDNNIITSQENDPNLGNIISESQNGSELLDYVQVSGFFPITI